MGRTIHIEVRRADGRIISEKEKAVMYDVSQKYNSGAYANAWSCEAFWLDAFDYYPNWSHYEEQESSRVWDIVRTHELELTIKYESRTKAITQMAKEKRIVLFNRDPRSLAAFVKTQGNEYNSLLVYQALIEISTRCPKLQIDVHDEGRFLLCDVRLTNGLAQPKLEALIDRIRYHCSRALLANAPESRYSALDAVQIPVGLCEELIKDVGIHNPYGERHSIEYINDALLDLKELQDAIRRHCDFPMHAFNIEQHWFAPMLLARKVDPKDFENYTMSVATLMDGFNGPYWNLTDRDSEAESYRASAIITGLASSIGAHVEILGAIPQGNSSDSDRQ